MSIELISMNRPSRRRVLDCASPLALWVDAGSAKRNTKLSTISVTFCPMTAQAPRNDKP